MSLRETLNPEHVAEVRSLDFKRLIGAGILHTKMWLVDDKHFYLGSANMDWRSLTQVKVKSSYIFVAFDECSVLRNLK